MGVIDLVTRAMSGPAGRVVEAPVRNIVQEAFRQAELPKAQELASLRAELSRLTADLHGLRNQLTELTTAVASIQSETQQGLAELRAALSAPDPRIAAAQSAAEARAEALSAGNAAALQAALAAQSATLQSISGSSAAAVSTLGSTLDAQISALSARLDQLGQASLAPPVAVSPVAEATAPEPVAPLAAEAHAAAAPVAEAHADEAHPAEESQGRPGRKSLAHLHCKIQDCTEPHRSKGFCGRHYQAWRRGRMSGFIGLDGLLALDGKTLRFAPALEAEPYTTEGEGAGLRVLVAGRPVPFEVV